MLNSLSLRQFKCFEHLPLRLANLTMLSGGNASGKSSVLQALVLLQQTMREHEWSPRLILNGESIKLGTVTDVVDKVNGRRGFEIGVSDDISSYHWMFSGERDDMSMAVDTVRIDGTEHSSPQTLQCLLPYSSREGVPSVARRIRNLTYITAERVGPREFYRLEDPLNAAVVGPTGEHAVSILHSGSTEPVIEGLVLKDVPPTRLHQVGARMQQFFPGCSLVVQAVPNTNAVTLGLRTSDDTDFHRPIHVGFGLTQVLPIIVAALSAAVDDIILIENPEVHLHPAGQALMGTFLAEVANAGVQVIIETHSDHVLNGIRRAVKAGLPPEKVALYFFCPRGNGGNQVENPHLDSSGNLDNWPKGFFDQFDKDMNYFAGWGE